MFSARVIASFGFGLSIFMIWFRWLAPLAVPPPSPRQWPKRSDNEHNRLLPSELGTYTLRKTINKAALLRHAHPQAVNVSCRLTSDPCQTAKRVGKPVVLSLQLSSLSDVESIHQRDSVWMPSTPIQTFSLPSTPTLQPTLTLENTPETTGLHRRSSSTSRLISMVKSPFRAKSKHFSFPCTLRGRSPRQTSMPTTPFKLPTVLVHKATKKTLGPFKAPWRRSWPEASIMTDKDTDLRESKASIPHHPVSTSRLFWSSNVGSRPSNQERIRHQPLTSTIFSRRLLHQPISSSRPRTLPYEAPYFACPPIPIRKEYTRIRSPRTSYDDYSPGR